MEVSDGDAGRLQAGAINIAYLQVSENLDCASVFGVRQACAVRRDNWSVVDGLYGQREGTGRAVEAWINRVHYRIADLDVFVAVCIRLDF